MDKIFNQNLLKCKFANSFINNFLNNIPDCVCVYRWNGKYLIPLFVSKPFSSEQNTKEAALKSDNNFAYVHPDDLPGLRQTIITIFGEKQTFSCVYRIYNFSEQQYIWTKLTASSMIQEDGTLIIYTVYTNINKANQIETPFSSASNIAIYKVTNHLEVLYFSQDIPALSGHTPEEYRKLIRDNATQLIYEGDRENAIKTIFNGIANHIDIDLTFRRKCVNDSNIWIHMSGFQIGTEDGHPLLYTVYRNISQEEEMYRNILNTSDRIIYVCDYNTLEILYVNKLAKFFHGNGHYLSEKCYKYLMNRETPCKDCKIHTLKDDVFFTKEYYSPKHNRYYIISNKLINWHNRKAFIIYMTDITKQKLMEQKLWESEKKYALAIESAGIHVWEYDILNRRIIQTKASQEIYGKDMIIENVPESLIERGHVIQKDIEAFRHMYNRILEGEQKVSGDFWLWKPNQRGRWCQRITYSVILNEEGKPTKAYGSSQNVTQLKLIEKKYEEELLYRKKIGGSILGTCRLNLSTRIVEEMRYGSKLQMKNKYRYATDFKTRASSFLTHIQITKEQNEQLSPEALINLHNQGIRSTSVEYSAQLKETGNYIWIHTDINLRVHPETEDIIGFFYHRDITREKALRNIVDSMINADYDFVGHINAYRNTCQMFAQNGKSAPYAAKYDYNQTVENYIDNFAVTDNPMELTDSLQLSCILKKLETIPVYTVEYNCRVSDTSIRRKQLRFTYIDQETKSIILVQADIDDIFKNEKQKQDELKQALYAAEKASNAKSQFLSRISHEIRTPMNAIIGLSALGAEQQDITPTVQEYFNKINASSHFLLEIINDILDMNRIENGKIKLHNEIVDRSSFFNTIIDLMQPMIAKKHIHFITDFSQVQIPYAIIDKMRTKQIYVNILNNAIKFSHEGGTVKWIVQDNIAATDINHIHYTSIIRDYGCGMSEEFQKRMFEPFEQEDNEYSNARMGTGLGLTIVKNLIEQMGGSILIKSKLNEGTEVSFNLDCSLPKQSISNSPIKPVPKFSEISLAGKHVLLVEDNQINRMVMVHILKKWGMTVDCAINGQEAVDQFMSSSAEFYNVILMDVRMPIMNGLQATQIIRNSEHTDAQKIPIIALSANAFLEDERLSLSSGMNRHLSKPVQPQQLYEVLQKFLFKK